MGSGTPLYGDRSPAIGQYVVIAGSALMDNERILTGTSNQIVVTDNGAGSTVVLSTPQDIHTGASPTFAGVTLTAAANISLTNTVAAGESLIDCHIIQGDDDALAGTLRGAYITASCGDEVATGTIRGIEMKARAGYPGETGANVNVLEGFSVSSDAKTYDVTTHRGGEIILDGGAGTSTLAVGLRIANNFQANRATTSYGLQIYRDSFDYTADIQLSSGGLIGGASGHLRIASSGAVLIDGSASVVQLTVQAHSTQTANMLEIEKSDGTVWSGADERGILFSDGGSADTNLFIGKDAGRSAATGASNFALGFNALTNLTSGFQNVAVGSRALQTLADGFDNVAVGFQALVANASGSQNVAIGRNALASLTTSGTNTAIGHAAGAAMQTGSGNTLIGYQAGTAVTFNNSVLIGFQAGLRLTTGGQNIFVGLRAGSRQTANSNLLIIDNLDRADVATEITNSILYGVMAATPAAQTLRINAKLYPLHVDQPSSTGAQPVLFLDQGDVSEQCIQFSSDAADRDINLFTVNVTGAPKMAWMETLDVFSLNKGLDITAGAASFNTLVLDAAGPTDDLDVSGVNTIFVDTSNNNVTLGGTTGGVDGQSLFIVVDDATNNFTIENEEGTGNQDFVLHAGADETMTAEHGGWIFVNHGGDHWHDASHAKHV